MLQNISEKSRLWGHCGGISLYRREGTFTSDTRMPVLHVQTPYDLTLGPPGVYRLHQAATFFTERLTQVGRYVRTDMEYVLDRELLYRIARKFPIVTDKKFTQRSGCIRIVRALPKSCLLLRNLLAYMRKAFPASEKRKVAEAYGATYRCKGLSEVCSSCEQP